MRHADNVNPGLVRRFSIGCFVGIVVAAVALMLFYRHMAIDTIVELGERDNEALAQSVLNSVRPELVDYLTSISRVSKEKIRAQSLPLVLEQAIKASMTDTKVVRIKFYNRDGMVVMSTRTTQVGDDQQANIGFLSAINGTVISELVYRDSFNLFDQHSEDDNLIQTYVPVRASPAQPIVGVLEIYTDVDALVTRTERSQIQIMLGVVIVLASLYLILLQIVRRADRLIEQQQATIIERTRVLELLSSRLLGAEENEKRRIAQQLHEGLAQTLAAIKIHVEKAGHDADKTSLNPVSLKPIVTQMQRAIEEVCSLAMTIHPSSLDEHGLVATLDWFIREFKLIYQDIQVEQEVSLKETEVPETLKGTIYRIVQDELKNIAHHGQSDHIHLSLQRADGRLVLTIKDNGVSYDADDGLNRQSMERKIGLSATRERTVLSGGDFSIESNDSGGTTTSGSWLC
jgi:signal transduction histidine kinase